MTLRSDSARMVAALLSVVLLCTAIPTASLVTPHIDTLELKSYDFLLTVLRGSLGPPDDVVIVAIDETSIKEFSSRFSWPWPRSVHGELIRQLNREGARAIVFDVVFDQSSDPAEDAELATAIRESSAPLVLAGAIENVQDRHFRLSQQIRPLAALTEAGARVGFAAIHPDADGVLRRAPHWAGGFPSLETAAFEAIGGDGKETDSPMSPAGARDFLIDYAGPARTVPTISYCQAIDAQRALPTGFFKSKTVWVGRSLSAHDIGKGSPPEDAFDTPFDPLMPGVEVHANALRTLSRGEPIRRSGAAWMWALLLANSLLVAAAMAAPLRLKTRLISGGALILLAPAAAAIAFLSAGYWLYSVQPSLAAGGIFVANTLYQYRTAERERILVRKALTGYVSKPVLHRLLDNPAALQLGGVQVEATVLFSDIVGFSSIAERMTPQNLTAELNAYFTRIGDIIMAHDGMIDKYIGDAIMAVWGAPLADSRQAVKACAAALAMRRAVAEAGGLLNARIGINSGVVMAGNLGHHERMEYTVIGDAVNLSSRLEGANKLYGTGILVSQSTMDGAAEEFIFRRVDRIRVVGKQQPVAVYELIDSHDGIAACREQARARSFGAIVEAYDRLRWQEGLEAIEHHRAVFPEQDTVVQLYEERFRCFESEPPAAGWDGVYSLSSK